MLHVVEAGTDAAALVLFDPKTLPQEFDVEFATDPTALLERLDKQGKLFWIDTGGDGGFLLHAYVNEPASDALAPFLRDPRTVDAFVVAGGALVFAGLEYAYRDVDSLLSRYLHMGSAFPIENGTYHVTLYRTEYPDDHLEQCFQQRVGAWQRRVYETFNTLAAVAVCAVFVLLASLMWLEWQVWLTTALPAVGAAIALPILLSRWPVYRRVHAAWTALEREYPSIVAVVSKRDG